MEQGSGGWKGQRGRARAARGSRAWPSVTWGQQPLPTPPHAYGTLTPRPPPSHHSPLSVDICELLDPKGPPRRVAVKKLSPNMNRMTLVDLAVEARLLRSISHPYITSYVGVGRDEAGRGFIVEEFVGGGTLNRMVARQMQRPHKTVFTHVQAAKWAEQIALALAYLHDANPGGPAGEGFAGKGEGGGVGGMCGGWSAPVVRTPQTASPPPHPPHLLTTPPNYALDPSSHHPPRPQAGQHIAAPASQRQAGRCAGARRGGAQRPGRARRVGGVALARGTDGGSVRLWAELIVHGPGCARVGGGGWASGGSGGRAGGRGWRRAGGRVTAAAGLNTTSASQEDPSRPNSHPTHPQPPITPHASRHYVSVPPEQRAGARGGPGRH